MLEHLLRKLESFSAFSDAERQAVRGMFTGSRRAAAGDDILQEGEVPTAVSLLLEGMVCRYRSLPDGQRQIMSFHIPGDLVDLHAFVLGETDHSIGCLTSCRLASAPYQRLEEVIDAYPVVARALWRDTAIDGAVWREWLVGMGRRSAYGRIAHLLCEVVARLKEVGLTDERSCELQLTQQELADSLGLSLVHVNRVLQRLRANGLITLGRGTLRVHDWEGLKQAGGFDAAYLRPRHAQAA